MTRPFSSSYAGLNTSAFPFPERSPLEPDSNFLRRQRKWSLDNARWEGQKRALEDLDKKKTRVPQTPDPRMFP